MLLPDLNNMHQYSLEVITNVSYCAELIAIMQRTVSKNTEVESFMCFIKYYMGYIINKYNIQNINLHFHD